jgi:hypothetical protein
VETIISKPDGVIEGQLKNGLSQWENGFVKGRKNRIREIDKNDPEKKMRICETAGMMIYPCQLDIVGPVLSL